MDCVSIAAESATVGVIYTPGSDTQATDYNNSDAVLCGQHTTHVQPHDSIGGHEGRPQNRELYSRPVRKREKNRHPSWSCTKWFCKTLCVLMFVMILILSWYSSQLYKLKDKIAVLNEKVEHLEGSLKFLFKKMEDGLCEKHVVVAPDLLRRDVVHVRGLRAPGGVSRIVAVTSAVILQSHEEVGEDPIAYD